MSNQSIKVFTILWIVNIINAIVIPYMEENIFWLYISIEAIIGFYIGSTMAEQDRMAKFEKSNKNIKTLLILSTLINKDNKEEEKKDETQNSQPNA